MPARAAAVRLDRGRAAVGRLYAVVLAASLAIVEAAPVPASQRTIATAALAAMVPWCLFLGRPLMTRISRPPGEQPST